jgi:hypothetical protein
VQGHVENQIIHAGIGCGGYWWNSGYIANMGRGVRPNAPTNPIHHHGNKFRQDLFIRLFVQNSLTATNPPSPIHRNPRTTCVRSVPFFTDLYQTPQTCTGFSDNIERIAILI